MTCQELADFICDYLEGNLPDDERRVFQSHLEKCPSCIAYLASIERTCKMVDDQCEKKLADAPEELIQAILRARGR